MDVIYHYDGSFEGFLSCVFDSYAHKEIPAGFCSGEDGVFSLFNSRTVLTDPDHAARVLQKVAALSPEAAVLLRRGFLTCLSEKELRLFQVVAKLLREGPGFLRNRSDETLYPVIRAVQHLNGEVHLLKGFVRFSDLGACWEARSNRKTGCSPCWAGTFPPGFTTSAFSSTTAPTKRPCSTSPASRSSGPWRISRWPRRIKRKPATASCGSGSTTPSQSRNGRIPASA